MYPVRGIFSGSPEASCGKEDGASPANTFAGPHAMKVSMDASYLYVFALVAGAAEGLAIGIFLMGVILRGVTGRKKRLTPSRLKQARQQKKARQTPKEDELEEEVSTPSVKDQLQSKKEVCSWTELNCSADNRDPKEYIEQNQAHEDHAYHYLKKKKLAREKNHG